MNDRASPKSIEPESWLGSAGLDEPVFSELGSLPVVVRFLVAAFMALVGALLALLGRFVGEVHH